MNQKKAFAAALLALVLAGGCAPAEEPEQPPTISYRDRVLVVKENVPVSTYDPTGFFTDQRGRVQYVQDGKNARTGVDVSVYQQEIDWAAVAADGVDFAMIRLGYRGYTQGGLNLDKQFEKNIQGALEAGLDVGVYFFSQAISPEEAEEEADFVLAALEGYDLTYPVAYDWEPIEPGNGARTDNMDSGTLTQCAKAFCARIREKGYAPVIYLNQDLGYLTFDLEELADIPIWLAEYGETPDFYYDFDLWQYSHTGQVAGIEGNVDLNLDLKNLKP